MEQSSLFGDGVDIDTETSASTDTAASADARAQAAARAAELRHELDFKRILEYHRSRWGRITLSNRTESAADGPGWIARSNHTLAISK